MIFGPVDRNSELGTQGAKCGVHPCPVKGSVCDHPAFAGRRSLRMRTPARAAARPYQVMAYCRWLFGRSMIVTPPTGRPPEFGVLSASMKNGTNLAPVGRPALAAITSRSFQ